MKGLICGLAVVLAVFGVFAMDASAQCNSGGQTSGCQLTPAVNSANQANVQAAPAITIPSPSLEQARARSRFTGALVANKAPKNIGLDPLRGPITVAKATKANGVRTDQVALDEFFARGKNLEGVPALNRTLLASK